MHILSFSDKRLQHFSSVTLLGVMIMFLATACGESKIVQCEKLIEAIQKGERNDITKQIEDEVQVLKEFENQEDATIEQFSKMSASISTGFEKIANSVDSYLEEIKVVELSDTELIDYQEEYYQESLMVSDVLRDVSTLYLEMSELKSTPEDYQRLIELASSANSFPEDLNTAYNNIGETAKNINSYCDVITNNSSPENSNSESEER